MKGSKIRKVYFDEGEQVKVSYNLQAKKGESVLIIDRSQTYTFEITATDASGSYDLKWLTEKP